MLCYTAFALHIYYYLKVDFQLFNKYILKFKTLSKILKIFKKWDLTERMFKKDTRKTNATSRKQL